MSGVEADDSWSECEAAGLILMVLVLMVGGWLAGWLVMVVGVEKKGWLKSRSGGWLGHLKAIK